jgi:hypothetical protein
VNDGQDLGNDFAGLASQRRCCHELSFLPGPSPIPNRGSPWMPTAAGIGAEAGNNPGARGFKVGETASLSTVALFRRTDNHYRLSGGQGQGWHSARQRDGSAQESCGFRLPIRPLGGDTYS